MQCDLLCLDPRTYRLALSTPVRRRALVQTGPLTWSLRSWKGPRRVGWPSLPLSHHLWGAGPSIACCSRHPPNHGLFRLPCALPLLQSLPPVRRHRLPVSSSLPDAPVQALARFGWSLRCVHISLLPMVNPQPSYGAASGSDGGEAGPGGAGPLRVGEENHAQAGEFLSDCVLGMSDGLTVPYVDDLACVLLSFSPGDALFFMTLPRSLFRPFCPGVCSPDSHLFSQSLPSPFIMLCSALSPPLRRIFFPPFVCGQLCPRCRPHLSRIIFIRDCPCRH